MRVTSTPAHELPGAASTSSSGSVKARAWLVRMVAEYGRELAGASVWARVVASGMGADVWASVGLVKPQELDTAPRGAPGAGAAAQPQPAGAVGRSPTPYAHKTHLLGRAVQHANTPTADPVAGASRGGVGSEPGTALARAVARGVGREPLDFLRTAEQLRSWQDTELELATGEVVTVDGRETTYLYETALRKAVQAATGAAIVDRDGRPQTCLEDGMVEQHVEVVEAFRFLTWRCDQRGRCPHCGRVYGLEQAEELSAIMDAAVLRADLQGRDALGWGAVVTLPRIVSEHLGRLAESADTRGKPLRSELRKLVQVAKMYAARLVLGVHRAQDRDEVRELAAAINLHWWSSSNPTSGWHWHAHIMIPNARRSGGKLRRLAKLSRERLDSARRRLGADLRAEWGELAGPRELRPNAHARWYLADKEGRSKWRHRARYDARHPFADVLKLAKSSPGSVFADEQLEALRTVAHRIEDLQRLKTRRYVGWLTPGRRKPEGLYRVEHGSEPKWRPVELGYRRVVGVTSHGFVLAYRDGAGEIRNEVMGRDIVLDDVRATEWEYRPEADTPGRAPPAEGVAA